MIGKRLLSLLQLYCLEQMPISHFYLFMYLSIQGVGSEVVVRVHKTVQVNILH
jgi:hypothetical protein